MPDVDFDIYVMDRWDGHDDIQETWILHVPIDGYNILLTVWRVPTHPADIVMANGAVPSVKPPTVSHDVNWQDLPDDLPEQLFNQIHAKVMADA